MSASKRDLVRDHYVVGQMPDWTQRAPHINPPILRTRPAQRWRHSRNAETAYQQGLARGALGAGLTLAAGGTLLVVLVHVAGWL
jgi:hypothetical protein